MLRGVLRKTCLASQRLPENGSADTDFSNRLTKYLLDRGATVGIKGREDLAPLHVALRHPDVVMLLLHRQADVHARSSAQRTPLHISATTNFARTCDVNKFYHAWIVRMCDPNDQN